MDDRRNWFDAGGARYSRFRPRYPRALAEHLASLHPGRGATLDIGCGSGQLTTHLAAALTGAAGPVVGLDPSVDQLTHAERHPRVRYTCSAAERLPVADHTVGLVTAAQAAHWFDADAFHAEVRRVCVPGAALALVTYSRLRLGDDAADAVFQRFYAEDVAGYWPAERRHVDSGYRTLPFPHEELPDPRLEITAELGFDDLLGYLSTWSAVRRARDFGRTDVLDDVADRLADHWPEDRVTSVTWPLTVRAGRVAVD